MRQAQLASVLPRHARPQAPSGPAARQLVQRNSYIAVPLALLVVLFIANAIVQPQFLSQQSWAASMAVLCPLVLTAMAVTLPILSGNGGIDLLGRPAGRVHHRADRGGAGPGRDHLAGHHPGRDRVRAGLGGD